MDFEIVDDTLQRLAKGEGDGAFQTGIGKIFRRRIQTIAAATDERTFYQLRSLHFEKLKGDRSHERSMRLNEQWRLIVEIQENDGGNKVIVKGIEDYH